MTRGWRAYFMDKVLPALVTGLLVAAVNTYVDVQILKSQIAVLRAELSDLWIQANTQIQGGK